MSRWRRLAWRCLIPLVVVSAAACGDDGPQTKPPPPKKLAEQQLHAPGELRLTSAGNEPRLRLRYRLEAGQYQGFRTRVEVKHRAAGQTSTLVALLDWERRLTAVTAGWARAEVAVRKVRLARPPSIREDVVRRLKGLTLRFDVDARGRARDSTADPKGARKGSPGGGAPSGLAAPLKGALLKGLTAPLPADAVGDSATWERYEPVTLTLPKTNLKLRVGVRTRYTLRLIKRGGRERFAEITSQIQLTAHSAAASSAGQRVTGGGRGTGTLRVDLKRGTVVSVRSELTLELSLADKGRTRTLKQTTTTSTRAIKLRPRPPRPTGMGVEPALPPGGYRPAQPG